MTGDGKHAYATTDEQTPSSSKLQQAHEQNTPNERSGEAAARRLATIMACFHPWKLNDNRKWTVGMTVPCGKCIGCRQVRQRDWAIRCMHEAQMHKDNCFITLTFKEIENPSLDHTEFQKFIRAIRKKQNKERRKNKQAPLKTIRYFMSGEYGKAGNRKHYHAIIFGLTFGERYKVDATHYASKELDRLWTAGYNTIGDVNWQTAMYVAKYATKNTVAGPFTRMVLDPNTGELTPVKPEYGRMSLRPGIGATWHDKYWREVHSARDGVVKPGGQKVPAPRYYNKRLEERNPELAEKNRNERQRNARSFRKDTTPDRLAVRETCQIARQRSKETKL